MREERSCGAVLFTRVDGEIRYLLAESLRGVYGFPKGHMEPGETERETALREIWEEVRIRPRLIGGFRETVRFRLPGGGAWKRVVLFLGEYEGQEPAAQREELRSAPLLRYEEAMRRLRYANVRAVLRKADAFLRSAGTPPP